MLIANTLEINNVIQFLCVYCVAIDFIYNVCDVCRISFLQKNRKCDEIENVLDSEATLKLFLFWVEQ